MKEKTLPELIKKLNDLESSYNVYENINKETDILNYLNETNDLRDKIIEIELDSYSFSDFNKFEQYLINVGIRSAEYTYSEELLFEHIDYFKKCYKEHLSAYKALLFFGDYLEELKQKKSE